MQLVPARSTTLSAEFPAKIDRISVREGESFAAGKTLVAFDCALQKAQLEEMRAILEAAKRKSTIHARLLELNSAGTLETELAATEVVKAEARFNTVRVVVSKCRIPAPYAGRVVTLGAHAHQYVQAGQPIMEILDDSILESEFIVPSGWIQGIRAGMAVTVAVTETGKIYAARVTRLGARIDPASHSVNVVAEIEGKHPELVAGMTGSVGPAETP